MPSWDVAGRLGKGSETTLRRRRDEWVQAPVHSNIWSKRPSKAFDKVIGLDLSEVSVDGSLHKAPMGGEATGPQPDRPGQNRMEVVGRHRYQRSANLLGHRRGQPQRLHPARTDLGRCRAAVACCPDIETLWLDRGYDSEPHPHPPRRTRHRRRRDRQEAQHGGQLPAPRASPWACAGRSNAPTPG